MAMTAMIKMMIMIAMIKMVMIMMVMMVLDDIFWKLNPTVMMSKGKKGRRTRKAEADKKDDKIRKKKILTTVRRNFNVFLANTIPILLSLYVFPSL